MALIKDELEKEDNRIKNLVLKIKTDCEKYLQNGNGANINSILDRANELKDCRVRYATLYYARNVEKVLETKLESLERKEEK